VTAILRIVDNSFGIARFRPGRVERQLPNLKHARAAGHTGDVFILMVYFPFFAGGRGDALCARGIPPAGHCHDWSRGNRYRPPKANRL